MVKLSDILNIILAMTTLGLVLYWILRVTGTDCFEWFDYSVSFLTLFINLGINIIAALGR